MLEGRLIREGGVTRSRGSQNGAVQVFGLPDVPTEVWVRWPGGRESRVAAPTSRRELVITRE